MVLLSISLSVWCKITCFLFLTMHNLTILSCTIAHTTSQWYRNDIFFENKLWEPNNLLCCEFWYYYCCFCNTHSFIQSCMHLLQHSACYWFILLFERRRIKCVIIFQVYGIVRDIHFVRLSISQLLRIEFKSFNWKNCCCFICAWSMCDCSKGDFRFAI